MILQTAYLLQLFTYYEKEIQETKLDINCARRLLWQNQENDEEPSQTKMWSNSITSKPLSKCLIVLDANRTTQLRPRYWCNLFICNLLDGNVWTKSDVTDTVSGTLCSGELYLEDSFCCSPRHCGASHRCPEWHSWKNIQEILACSICGVCKGLCQLMSIGWAQNVSDHTSDNF